MIFDISIRPKCVSIQYHCLMYHDIAIYRYIVASLCTTEVFTTFSLYLQTFHLKISLYFFVSKGAVSKGAVSKGEHTFCT